MALPDDIERLRAPGHPDPDVQQRQLRFRLELVRQWPISVGARVLEIGCGQGDMTVVLADAVGETGHVTAVDIAPPSYGSPVTLGEATRAISEGWLGPRIDFRLEFDPLGNRFEDDAFDVVVFAHCSWYFGSLSKLGRTFAAVRPWAKRLCLSEWNMFAQSNEQIAHQMAVMVQGLVKSDGANVREPFTAEMIRFLLERNGWAVTSEADVDSSYLDDGRWEVDMALTDLPSSGQELGVAEDVRASLDDLLELLRDLRQAGPIRSLPSISMIAERAANP